MANPAENSQPPRFGNAAEWNALMAYENIIVEVGHNIGLVQLNRQNKRNALNQPLRTELCDALTELDRNANVRCLVLTGAGKDFCAGADIAEMSEKGFVEMYASDQFAREAQVFESLRKPIIAGVAGRAFGGGCEIAMMCDIIIAAESAVFGQPEINIGVIAGMGGTQRLTRAVGKTKSMEMHLTGRSMHAAEAAQSGLVSRVVEDGELQSEVMSLAHRIAEKPLLAVLAVKEAVNRAEELSLREGLLFERRLFHSIFATADKEEGMQAFIDKRTPRFRGR